MKRYLSTLILAAAASSASAETPKPDLAKAEQIVTNVCAACHGANGMSLAPTNPHLAGQHPAYIAKQLANFKAGVRQNAIMGGMAAILSPEDMVSVAAYYAKQTPPSGRQQRRAGEGRGGDLSLRQRLQGPAFLFRLPCPERCRHPRPVSAPGRPAR